MCWCCNGDESLPASSWRETPSNSVQNKAAAARSAICSFLTSSDVSPTTSGLSSFQRTASQNTITIPYEAQNICKLLIFQYDLMKMLINHHRLWRFYLITAAGFLQYLLKPHHLKRCNKTNGLRKSRHTALCVLSPYRDLQAARWLKAKLTDGLKYH